MPDANASQPDPAAPASAAPARAETDPRADDTLRALAGRSSARPDALLELMKASDLDPEAVIRAIEFEPALCGRVLAICHSVAGGGAKAITTVRRAVLHLGPKRVKALGMAYGVQLMAEALMLPDGLMKRFWQTTIWKAEGARLLADALCPELQDDAFMLGLLQDIGLPALLATDPGCFDDFEAVENGDWLALETERFGMDHAVAGARLLAQWGVPDELCAAVATHHAPDPADIAVRPELRIPCFTAALLPHQPDRPLDEPAFARLELLRGKLLGDRFPATQDMLDAIARRALGRIDEREQPDTDNPAASAAQILAPILQTVARTTAELVGQSIAGDACAAPRPEPPQSDALEDLRHQAYTDELTRLLSRRGFRQLAEQRLASVRMAAANTAGGNAAANTPGDAARPLFASANADRRIHAGAGTPAADDASPEKPRPQRGAACLIMLDLNKFKPINDTYGHAAGDRALRGIADTLRKCVRSTDVLGRLGGDEFVLLLDHIPEEAARRQAHRIHEQCSGFKVEVAEGVRVEIGFSLGAAWHPALDAHPSLDDLIGIADAAMYRAKRADGTVAFEVVGDTPARTAA